MVQADKSAMTAADKSTLRFEKVQDILAKTNKEFTPKGRCLDPPPEGAHDDCLSSQSFSGGMACPGATCTEEPDGVAV